MNLNIREMLPNERDYAYTQSYQLMTQSGCITLMRGEFGNGGKTFYPDYEDQIKQYRTDEFAAEFDSVIKEFYKVGILADRDSMLEYCCARPDGRFMGNFSREYGYRIDTEKYTYLLRCIPSPGDNNFYCYAYVSEFLNQHMEKAAQGIRFIDSHYNELFRLPDGGSIIITHRDGRQIKAYCRFVDETHTEIGEESYHICEFAERMEACGAVYLPAEPPMPEMCYSTLPSSGEVMQAVVQEINTDYQTQLDTTKANISYDVLEMSGSRAVWPEVLSIYAVKTTTDPDNAQEVATMDDSKKAILKDIFWQMNEISSQTETKTEEVITETDDGHGNIVETKTTVTRTYLYITISHKTAEEMADQYHFSADQRKQLAELLADENRSMWSAVLYGIGTGDDEIVTVALSQIGNVGGQPYWSWYGFNSRVEWCACFVSWCANECGYIDAGIIPKFAGCIQGSNWFKERGLWQDGSFTPSAGHIIFFDWEGDGETDHVGIVEKVENGTVYTVEGNSGDTCKQNSYSIGNSVIYGYGTPAY